VEQRTDRRETMETKIMFVDGFEGVAEGGFFVRNDLFRFIKKLEKSGEKVIGIRVDDSWNLEIIVERRTDR